jgi:hypothetical protein
VKTSSSFFFFEVRESAEHVISMSFTASTASSAGFIKRVGPVRLSGVLTYQVKRAHIDTTVLHRVHCEFSQHQLLCTNLQKINLKTSFSAEDHV